MIAIRHLLRSKYDSRETHNRLVEVLFVNLRMYYTPEYKYNFEYHRSVGALKLRSVLQESIAVKHEPRKRATSDEMLT